MIVTDVSPMPPPDPEARRQARLAVDEISRLTHAMQRRTGDRSVTAYSRLLWRRFYATHPAVGLWDVVHAELQEATRFMSQEYELWDEFTA